MADTTSYTCAQCGAPFTGRKRKYCSRKCGWTATARRRGKVPLDQHLQEIGARRTRTCPECRREFKTTRHDKHAHGPQVHCSNMCAQRARNKTASLVAYEREVYKAWSLRAHGSSVAQRAYEAKLAQGQARKYLLGHIIRYVLYPAVECEDCGIAIGASTAHRTYCEQCSTKRRQAHKRASRLARKAAERAATVEVFDPLDVLERDGWRCHICGCRTPKRLRGTYAPNAPELDHIISLADGGEHSPRNTACACRKCNGLKGRRSFGQLRLVA